MGAGPAAEMAIAHWAVAAKGTRTSFCLWYWQNGSGCFAMPWVSSAQHHLFQEGPPHPQIFILFD
jgi:hypothetical protein